MIEREAEATNAPRPGTAAEGPSGGRGGRGAASLVLPILAFAALVAFLGILAAWVPRVDLVAWIAVTIVLVAVDFFVRRS